MRFKKIGQLVLLTGASFSLLLTGCSNESRGQLKRAATRIAENAGEKVISEALSSNASRSTSQAGTPSTNVTADNSLATLTYTNQQIVTVNHNQPTFTAQDLSLDKGDWQQYSDLDALNRVGVADAMLSHSSMPTEQRQRLTIQPTGWRQKFVLINGSRQALYNRCHLIGYQLTGQNNNAKNLMTGTRSLNDPAMTTYENQVASYLKTTDHHVRYEVRPVFQGNELVARGVQMQGESIEDRQIKFNVYIFNVQTGVKINYADGTSEVSQNYR